MGERAASTAANGQFPLFFQVVVWPPLTLGRVGLTPKSTDTLSPQVGGERENAAPDVDKQRYVPSLRFGGARVSVDLDVSPTRPRVRGGHPTNWKNDGNYPLAAEH